MDWLSIKYLIFCPSCNLFCRTCLYTRDDLYDGTIKVKQQRTVIVYNEHLNLLKNANYSNDVKTLTGMHGECCLHSSRFFHICRNYIFDPMHDILCGIGPMILKLVLAHYVIELKFFNIEDFNDRLVIISIWFRRKEKTSANFSKRILNQKGNILNQKLYKYGVFFVLFLF